MLQEKFPVECLNASFEKYCTTCKQSFSKRKIPTLCKFNGYHYPPHPPNLPPLDIITERLISPRIPFMTIRRLRRELGTFKIIGQVINIPVDVDNMVKELPRELDDDFAFNVSIKKHILHKTSSYFGQVKKSTIKAWLSYMVTTSLYKHYNITYNADRFNAVNDDERPTTSRAAMASSSLNNEEIELLETDNDNEILMAQQQTMLWNEGKYLDIAPGQNKQPLSVIFDSYAEELSFPGIYYGQPRVFKEGVKATPFNIASSEIRRRDRRGATPQHILYMAAKIIRLRVSNGLHSVFKYHATTENMTRRMLQNKEFINECVEKNLSFLTSLPNSMQYWHKRKQDLFAMIRQLGKPTMFLTISANEIRWPHLLNILHKFSKDSTGQDLTDPMNELRAFKRSQLVNEDPVICCLYFNKLVNIIMHILSVNKAFNPFGKYRIVDYFKRIEFQHRGSPHAHILIWLNNVPNEPTSENMPQTIKLITDLCSVSAADLPNKYNNQVHQHTFTCYKKNNNTCRFNIPYWPMDETRILLPLNNNDNRMATLKKRAKEIHKIISEKIYYSFQQFLNDNNVTKAYYLDVIRSSLTRATVIFKREMNEIWTNTFNPWIAEILNSNMDLQFILDEYSCAAYVVEYVNKSSRGISNLHKQIIELQEHNPDDDYFGLLKKICINMLNTVEMSCQEGAWYLLRLPMSESSKEVIFIPTMWASERHKTHKRRQQLDREDIDDDSTDIWNLNVMQKYESRPENLHSICLADFAAWYTWSTRSNTCKLRRHPRILRSVNYSMIDKCSEYKREMVTLYLPFTCEHTEITDQLKYLTLFDDHHQEIMRNFAKYNVCDIDKHIEQYNRLCQDLQQDREMVDAAQERRIQIMATTAANNDDIHDITPGHLNAVVRQRTNVMTSEEFCKNMNKTNPEQRDFLLTLMHALITEDAVMRIFFTGAAGTGKTFTLNLAMEITNRFTQNHSCRTNAFVACASTGKAAVALGGTTVHSAFRIAISKRTNSTMSREYIQSYRNSFAGVKVIFIDEVSMLSADILNKINGRMCEITGNFDVPFGGKNVIFCGDLRQLPPVNARPIFKPLKNSICGAFLWQSLEYYNLTRVMRQSDIAFSNILTKIGNGEKLTEHESLLIESRFRTPEWCKENVPNAIRLFHSNTDVDNYNLESITNYTVSECIDTIVGYRSNDELVSTKTKLYKLSVTECGGLPYILKLSINKPYMITCNIDVEDGIVNGAIGIAKYLEYDEDDNQILKRIWIYFENPAIGNKLKIKSRPLVASRPGVLSGDWTPITKRHAKISMSNTVKCTRVQFPLTPACALTIHKSQGGSFNEVVYKYDSSQLQQLVYVALSRVTTIEGLFLINEKNIFSFVHKKGCDAPNIQELRQELSRLQNHKLETVCDRAKKFLNGSNHTFMFINVQSLKAHTTDIETDIIMQSINCLLLSETWVNNEVNLKDFQLICHYKRPNVRAGGVSIYVKNMIAKRHEIDRTTSEIGDLCAIEISINHQQILLASIYINPNTPINEIILFISRHFIQYSKNIGIISNSLANADLHKIPIILCGDFNIDFSKKENENFLKFMLDSFGLILSSPKTATTLGGSCIDAIFSRNISLECHIYMSYFSYHMPILCKIQIEN